MTLTQKQRDYLPVAGILILAALLRFWDLFNLDLMQDGAINAYRALGWFDYLADSGQTAPLNWFGSIPWWGNLSFHDHPPLVFFITKLFLTLFGDTTVAALLPHLIAGTATTLLVYGIGKTAYGHKVGLLAMLIYAISSYAIWGSRTAYLEGVLVVWIALSLYFFVRYLKYDRIADYALWAFAAGLALLSKYTALFLLPPVVIALLVWKRSALKNIRLWLSGLIIPLLLTPVIIYNFFVFKTRGHFDATLSSMIGMRPDDFATIAGRTSALSLWGFRDVLQVILDNNSLLLCILVALALGKVIYDAFKRTQSKESLFILISFTFLLTLFAIGASDNRFLSVMMPFVALLTAFGLRGVWASLSKPMTRRIALVVVILALTLETAYAINTNLLKQPIELKGLAYSGNALTASGLYEVDKYLRANVLPDLPRPTNPEQIKHFDFPSGDVILIDERMNWFSLMWHLRRYLFFYNLPVVTIKDVFDTLAALGEKDLDALTYLKYSGAQSFWFLYVEPAGVDRENIELSYMAKTDELKKFVDESGIEPVRFYNDFGEHTFSLYHFDFVIQEQ